MRRGRWPCAWPRGRPGPTGSPSAPSTGDWSWTSPAPWSTRPTCRKWPAGPPITGRASRPSWKSASPGTRGSSKMAAERLAAGIGVVGVVGAGTMGAGIAQVAAAAGCRVLLYDVSDAQLQRAVDQIGRRLRRAVERGRLNAAQADATLARIRTTTSLDDLAPSDVVIEAAPEDMDLKRRILGRLGEICSPE